MANEIAATIKINGNSEGEVMGGSSSTDVLKDLLKEVKDIKYAFTKKSTLDKAGLGALGAGQITGGLLKSIQAAAIAAAAAVGGSQIISSYNSLLEKAEFLLGNELSLSDKTMMAIPGALPSDLSVAFEKVNISGEEKVLKIDQKTGEILESLTIQEARERNIVDSKGDIQKWLDSQNSIFDKMTSNLEDSAGYTLITSDNQNNIVALTDAEKNLRKLIVQKLSEQAEDLGEKGASKKYIDMTGFDKRIDNNTVSQSGDLKTMLFESDPLARIYYRDVINENEAAKQLISGPSTFIDLKLL